VITIAERVAAGAAFLDEHDPGWWQRIDLPTLDLSCESHCVLGQTCPLEVLNQYSLEQWGIPADETDPDDRYLAYAHELSGIDSEREVITWAHERGFALIGSPRDAGAWLDLTSEWKRVITARREATS
jgi:hypothetical protein